MGAQSNVEAACWVSAVNLAGWLATSSKARKTRAPATALTKLELELIQTHMAQQPLVWVEVGAHAVHNRSKCGGVGWAGAGVAWRGW